MSYIDNLRLKAANVGSKPITLTGGEIISLLNEIDAIAAMPVVSGWAVTGTTTLTGAVTIDADGNTVEFIGGEVGIGGAAVAGQSLAVNGSALIDNAATFEVKGETLYPNGLIFASDGGNFILGDVNFDVGGTQINVNDSDQQITLSAADGVSTTAGLNVGGTLSNTGIQTFATNAAAIIGGLVAGDVYALTATNALTVVV